MRRLVYHAFMDAVSEKNSGLLKQEKGSLNQFRLNLGISPSARRVLRLGGVHHSGWWPPIFMFLKAAEKMAIGEKLYYQAKLYYHAKVRGFRVCILAKQ